MRDQTLEVSVRPNPVAVLLRRPLVQAFLNDPITVISATFVLLVVFTAIFAPLVAPHNHKEQHLEVRHLPPFSTGTVVTDYSEKPYPTEDRFFVLGTDHLERDYFSRLVYGGRISLAVGVLGVLFSSSIGVFLGLAAGYFRGVVDDIIMRAVDVFMTVPLLLLALIVIFVLGPSFINILLVFAVARWMLFCRVTRGVVLSLREQTFVEAARGIGCTDQRIITRHILPNLITPILTLATLDVPATILTESTLSFLGFGIQPPESSWGLMLGSGRLYITSAWWIVVVPGVAIFLTALSFNLFGVWMRAVSDPLQRWRWLKATTEAKDAGISF